MTAIKPLLGKFGFRNHAHDTITSEGVPLWIFESPQGLGSHLTNKHNTEETNQLKSAPGFGKWLHGCDALFFGVVLKLSNNLSICRSEVLSNMYVFKILYWKKWSELLNGKSKRKKKRKWTMCRYLWNVMCFSKNVDWIVMNLKLWLILYISVKFRSNGTLLSQSIQFQ